MNADITIKATYASVVEDEGQLFIGFAEGHEGEPYAMFRQSTEGGPIWFEVSDETLGGDDVIESVTLNGTKLSVLIKPEKSMKLGFARHIAVNPRSACEDRDMAIDALRDMLGELFIE